MIGAAHAGWRGALTGVIEQTVAAMEKLGAKRERIVAAAGPMIRQPSYEVGQDLLDRFVALEPNTIRFFKPAKRPGHSMFDLAGYVVSRLRRAEVGGNRGPRALHLCRSGAVLFLPPRHPSGGTRLRPSYQRDRAGRLTTSAAFRTTYPRLPRPGRVDRGRKYGYQFVTRPAVGDKKAAARGGCVMQWRVVRARVGRVATDFSRPVGVLAVAALAASAAGCSSLPSDGRASLASAATPGSTLAFESIDGPPPEVFRKLVTNLNDEAGARKIAVVPRSGAATYRVRGYVSALVERDKTTFAWVWDVYDTDKRRTLRIAGEEPRRRRQAAATPGPPPTSRCSAAWPMNGMDRIAGFLNSSGTGAVPLRRSRTVS